MRRAPERSGALRYPRPSTLRAAPPGFFNHARGVGMTSRSRLRSPASPAGDVTAWRTSSVVAAAQLLTFLKITLVAVLFDPRAYDTFTLPKVAVSETLTFAIAAAVLLVIVKHPERLDLRAPQHLAVALFLGAFALASVVALDKNMAVFGAQRRYLGLFHAVDLVVMYFAGAVLFSRAIDRARLLLVIGASAVPVIVYAFVQHLGLDPLTYVEAATSGRAIGTIGQPDPAGAYFAIVAVTMLCPAALSWGAVVYPARIGVALVGVGALAGLIFTQSRSGVVGLIFGWLAVGALLVVGRRARRGLLVGWLGTGFLGVVGVALSPIGARLSPEFLMRDTSTLGRLELWSIATRLFLARPILAYGPDHLAPAFHSPQ